MKIVNLTQSRVRYSDIEPIKAENAAVFFAVQVNEGKKYFYEIKKHEIATDLEKVIRRYEMKGDSFYRHKACMYDDLILVVKLEEIGQVGVEILDVNGQSISTENIPIDEVEGEEVIFINKNYFLVSGESKRAENVYYLCDIEEGRSYRVTTARLIDGLPVGHGLMRELPCFKRQDEEWVVFNECYMEDYEYEKTFECIMAKNFDASQIRETEGLYVIPLNTLIDGIKHREDIIPFREIKKRWIDGWVRYLGMKNGNIYYREKDFETQIEMIYAIDMESLEEVAVCEINHQQLQGPLRYDLTQIYEDIRGEEKRYVKGHYGLEETLEIPTHKRLRFEAYLENRYIITSWWWENEVDGIYEYKEFVGIEDKKKQSDVGQMIVYEGQCYVQEGLLLIY